MSPKRKASKSKKHDPLENMSDIGRALPASDSPRPKAAVGKKTKATASLLATFYPKFENDSAETQTRDEMIGAVSAHKAVLEVSVKHSGSLFMWSGAQRGAFAKNSYGNEYSAVGVWVLSQTLKNAWGADVAAARQQELSQFLESNRVAVAMELVTAVLGDHGQRPKQDYVVVTAVVDMLGQPRFYSTPQVVEFCRRWRLPTNSYWLFSSKESVGRFMSAYAALAEDGTTQIVEDTLTAIADLALPGSAAHGELQGDIMEGLVARLVSPRSLHLLRSLPTPLPGTAGGAAAPAAGAGVRLRALFKQHTSNAERIKVLLKEAGDAMCSPAQWEEALVGTAGGGDNGDDVEEGAAATASAAASEQEMLSSEQLLGCFLGSAPADAVTRTLQEMVREVHKRKLPMRFKCRPSTGVVVEEEEEEEEGRRQQAACQFVVTVHAHSDSAFRRYQRVLRENPSMWPLYRGFFFHVILAPQPAGGAGHAAAAAAAGAGAAAGAAARQEEEGDSEGGEEPVKPAMLKMKLLPYKTRTFLLRNALTSLFKEGRPKYLSQCQQFLKTWGTSAAKTREMLRLCNAWAEHMSRKRSAAKEHGWLDGYLDEAEPFLEHFYAAAAAAPSSASTSDAPHTDGAHEDADEDDNEHEGEGEGEASVMVFFPGIPGCAKSAICRAIKERGGLGDRRHVTTFAGDSFQGKYWKEMHKRMSKAQEKAQEEEGGPGVLMLADKNAPGRDVWDQIHDIATSTGALCVPLIPPAPAAAGAAGAAAAAGPEERDGKDASQSQEEGDAAAGGREGGRPRNPYEVELLAVFMHRVLHRANHPAGLDGRRDDVGSVLLMFHQLYEGMSREEFEEELRARFGVLAFFPVLKPDRPALPSEVSEHVQLGKQLYAAFRKKHGKFPKVTTLESEHVGAQFKAWEARLRHLLDVHSGQLQACQVALEDVVESVVAQLKAIVGGRKRARAAQQGGVGSKNMAVVEVPQEPVWAALRQVAASNKEVAHFLKGKEEDVKKRLARAHVTLAHKRSHGYVPIVKCTPLVGTRTQVGLLALLWSDRCAALEVALSEPDQQRGVRCLNEFPHLTVWAGPKVQSKESNDLPVALAEGSARRVVLPKHTMVTGTVAVL